MGMEQRIDLTELLSLKDTVEACEQKAYGIQFHVRNTLTLSEIKAMTDFVVETCMVNGVYEPSVFDFAWRIAVLRFFTDLELPREQKDLEKLAFVLDKFYICAISASNEAVREGVRIAVMETLEMRKREKDIVLLGSMIPDPLGNLTAMLESALEKSNTLLEGGGLAKVEELLGRLSETDKAGAVLRLAGMPAKKARPKKRAGKQADHGQEYAQLSVDDILESEK